ncbi:MAG TPA: DUF6807 family protein, partial [Oceanipulchritudo sp.]|nr:DUF6807 family protein [Oceanipulchritudo sp.]
PQQAHFQSGNRQAGIYVLDDPFKPYLHPLRTPAGHCLTLAFPMDHRHHKGLMYALRCADLNFWEECPGSGSCGVQRLLKTETIDNGIRQELLWVEESGSLETYHEVRTGTCHLRDDASAFDWTWQSERVALRDHRLIKSEWSSPLPDGRRINYHGLGIRLPWAWAFRHPAFSGVELDGEPLVAPGDASGKTPESVRWWGRIDGFREPPLAELVLHQNPSQGCFALQDNFAYLALGPSVLKEMDVAEGRIFSEHYRISAGDVVPEKENLRT